MEDKEIIELFFARDQEGIAALVDKYGRLCRQVSMNVLGSFEDADECVNDTWLATWNQIPPQKPTSLAAYVAKITKNLSLKKYRDDRKKYRDTEIELCLDEMAECTSDQQTESEDELREIIEKFLNTLSTENRVIFVKRYWFDESVKAIATEIGLSENSVSVKLHRLRKRLKKYLQEVER